MNPQHRMILDSDNGEELLFACPYEGQPGIGLDLSPAGRAGG
jgi:hypothetical protein